MSEVLSVLNALSVFEYGSPDYPYMLVENNEENIEALESVGISRETAEKYGDDEYFCVLALALSEGLAEEYTGIEFV